MYSRIQPVCERLLACQLNGRCSSPLDAFDLAIYMKGTHVVTINEYHDLWVS